MILLRTRDVPRRSAATRGEIEAVCRENGLTPPTICTPIELMEV